MRTLNDLKKGESAIIDFLLESELSNKLLSMGFIPGEEIKLQNIAPLNCPIIVEVFGSTIIIRRSDAKNIFIK